MNKLNQSEIQPQTPSPSTIARQEQQNLAEQHTVSANLNLSTADSLVPTSIVEKSGNEYLKLKTSINPNIFLQVQTLESSLSIRNPQGSKDGSLAQNEQVQPTGEFLVFKTGTPEQKVLMLQVRKVNQETPLGYVAAPYLKLADVSSPQVQAQSTQRALSPEVPQTTSRSPEVALNDQKIIATKPEELLLIGDSITEGISSTTPKFTVNFQRGRTTDGHLKELRTLFTQKKFPESVKSVVIYGAINDLGPQGTGSTEQAIGNISKIITLLKSQGIQPVVSTMFQTLANAQGNPEADPLNQKVQAFNQQITALAKAQKIPLIDFAKIPNPSGKIHPDRQVYQQMANLIQQSYERPTS